MSREEGVSIKNIEDFFAATMKLENRTVLSFIVKIWAMLALFFSFFLATSSLYGLENQPWFGEVYQFYFTGKYAYSTYRHVNDAVKPLASRSQDHWLYFGLDTPVSPEWSFDCDWHFIDTPRQSFSFQTVGLQARYLWMDDIVGDPVTLTTAIRSRYISKRSQKDISSPYHGDLDFEGTIAIGKESDERENWKFRVWGLGGLGMANRGSPWVRGILAFEGNARAKHKLGFFTYMNHGFGKKTKVDIDNFRGYGQMRYKWVDLKFRYGYKIGNYGTIRLAYQRRIVAKRAPEDVDTFIVTYFTSFSF